MTQTQFDIVDYWERINKSRRDADYLVNFYQTISAGEPYPDREHALRAQQREWMAEQIRRFGWSSLLDAGCGPGFWFQLWDELNLNAHAADRAESARPNCDEMNKRLTRPVPLSVAKLNSLPFGDKTFDVAVTVKVLLHTLPEEIESTLAELGRVARHLMLLERNSTGGQLRDHVFEHDLAGIAAKLGYRELVNETFTDHQRFFVFECAR